MAAISSNVDILFANVKMLWSNTSTWVGGVVPGIGDDVTITGARTTINQAAFGPWTGTTTITVASTSGFPSTGFFYTYTNLSDYVKINYTGTTATTFTGCSIDFTDPMCDWKYNTAAVTGKSINYFMGNYSSRVQNAAYVYGPSPIITIPKSYYANVSTMIINNGGILNMEPGSNLTANNWLTVRDGRFIGRANVGNVSTVLVNRAEASGPGYFQTENYNMSILDVDGGETRAYGTINTAMSIGTTNVAITMVQGSLEVGDEVTIYDNSWANNRVAFYPYRDISADWTQIRDEGFDVCGKLDNQIWLSRRNGARGKILSSSTSGTNTTITVDKNDFLTQLQFKAGDTVVINNKQYTITNAVESQYSLASYDFTAGSTLSDFLIDSLGHSSWAIDAYGAYCNGNTTSWHHLVNKNIYRREIIIEADMSPWSQWTYGSGTRGTDQYGLIFNFDAQFRNGTRNLNDGLQTGRFIHNASDVNGPSISLASKSSAPNFSNWSNTSLDTSSTTLTTLYSYPNTQKIEVRNNIIEAFLNGEQIGERWDASGGIRGLSGCMVWNNPYVRIARMRYYAPTQDLTIATTDSFAANSVVYEAGAEYTHTAGQRILKIASKVVNPGTHDDLSFAFRGAYEPGVWPMPINYNGTSTSGGMHMLLNHDFFNGSDVYYFDLGTTANSSVTIDLTTTRTFTHVSWTPRCDDLTSRQVYMKGIKIEGSNDNSTWTTLYGPLDDTRRYANPTFDSYHWYTQMGFYPTGSVSYRYIKFTSNGNSGSTNGTLNRHYKFGVHNFVSNNYTIQVNNSSDFVAGDTIAVLPHAAYGTWDDIHHYDCIKGTYTTAQNPDTLMWTSNTHSTVVSVDSANNILYLDRPINYGYIEGQSHHNGETVVKLNRNFKMVGWLDAGSGKFQKPYFKINAGTNACQIRWLKNWQFYNVGSSRLSASSFYRGVDLAHQDYWNPVLAESLSVTGYNNSDANGLTLNVGWGIVRNSVVTNVRDFRPYYSCSREGTAVYNNKIAHCCRFRPESMQNRVTNYNEAAGCRNWDVFLVHDIDVFASKNRLEFRRNYLHACYGTPAFQQGSGVLQSSGMQPHQNEYNRIIGTNYISFNNGPTPVAHWPKGMDIHAEHGGLRLSQHRNEGFINYTNFATDISVPVSGLTDFLRADYDVSSVAYDMIIKRNGWDFIRTHRTTDDSSMPKTGISFYVKDPVSFQVFIEFEYRMPMRINRIGNVAVGYSKLMLIATQNGSYVSGGVVLIPLPSDDGWVKYSTTITSFTATPGVVFVCIGQRSMQTFVDFRNMRAYIKTNNPDSISLLSNTFDTNKYFNLANDKSNKMPLSTPANQIKTVKF